MAELTNSRRTMLQAVYSPIEVDVRASPVHLRAWDKWSYAARVASIGDLAKVAERLQSDLRETEDPAHMEQLNLTLADISRLVPLFPRGESRDPLVAGKVLKDMTVDSLLMIGTVATKIERERAEKLRGMLRELSAAYSRAFAVADSGYTQPPQGYEVVSQDLPTMPGMTIYRMERLHPAEREDRAASQPAEAAPPSEETGDVRVSRGRRVISVMAVRDVNGRHGVYSTGALSQPLLNDVLSWAIQTDAYAEQAHQVQAACVNAPEGTTVALAEAMLEIPASGLHALAQAFAQRSAREPIGLLHLERLSFTPAGMERGELQHSVPLSPGEEVNIAHREWSNTSEEFEKLVTDSLEDFSERGVTEKSEMSESSEHQDQHSRSLNTGVSISAAIGPVQINSSLNYSVQDSASNSAKASREHTKEITSKASSRTKKEHKITFRTASAAGTEDQRVCVLKNPYADKAVRVDYYQLVRRWRVDLERYGVRLTYDLTVPEPGADLLARYQEIQDLEEKLGKEFTFELTPEKITRANLASLEHEYGASVEPAPPPGVTYTGWKYKSWPGFDEAHKADTFEAVEFDVDPRYSITQLTTDDDYWMWKHQGDPHLTWWTSLDHLLGTSGKVSVVFELHDLGGWTVWVKIEAKLRPEVFEAWQLQAWFALREAAEATFEASRQRMADRLKQLKEEVAADDALTLRKIEREEVMKAVMRWLLGPSFRFTPALAGVVVNEKTGYEFYTPEQAVLSESVRDTMLSFGEFIKFIHQAIEWENVLYFLYPYFWTRPEEWKSRLNLRHPDLVHQQFLRAGAARVVLTIRPGYEQDFTNVIETLDWGKLGDSHPYMTIATEMQNYAQTNYPGIPSANPSRHGGAWRQIQQFSAALERFYDDCGRYPTLAEGLDALKTDPGVGGWNGPYLKTIPHDPWGNAYVYTSPGEHGGFDIVSLGADGKPGGKDGDADVVSWAEGSNFGTWYEYTPTSALDVTIGDPIPAA